MTGSDDERDPNEWPPGLSGAEQYAAWDDPTLPPPRATDEVERRAVEALAGRIPHLGSREIKPVQFAEAYARLVAVSMARAEFLGHLLEEAYAAEGISALIGHKIDAAGKDGELYEASEETRGLAAMEERERDRAAKLIKDGLRIGIEAKHVDVLRSYGQTVVASLRLMCTQFGIPWEDPATRRAASRAIVGARTQQGETVASMDRAGLPLSEEERVRLIGGAG
jgi:hypothetical protein